MIALHLHSPHEISFYAKNLPEEERNKIVIVEEDNTHYFITYWEGNYHEFSKDEIDIDSLLNGDIRVIYLVPEGPAYKKSRINESEHLKELRGYCESIDKATKELQEKGGPEGIRLYQQVLDNLDEIIAFFISFEIESDSVTEALNETLSELNELGQTPASPLFFN